MVVEWTIVSNPSAMIFQAICQYPPDSSSNLECLRTWTGMASPISSFVYYLAPGFPRELFGSGTTQWSAHASPCKPMQLAGASIHCIRHHLRERLLYVMSASARTISRSHPESLNSTASTCLGRNRVDLCTKIGLCVQSASKFVDNQKFIINYLI